MRRSSSSSSGEVFGHAPVAYGRGQGMRTWAPSTARVIAFTRSTEEVFQDVAGGPRPQGVGQDPGIGGGGKGEHGQAGMALGYEPDGLDASHDRHVEVHEDQFGVEVLHQIEDLGPSEASPTISMPSLSSRA